MECVIDTHALHWFLEDSPTLSNKARRAIEAASIIYIPAIVLLEFLFVAKKKGRLATFQKFLRTLPNEKFSIYPLDTDILTTSVVLARKTQLEIHDLIIVATSKRLRLSLITKDPEIREFYKKTIW